MAARKHKKETKERRCFTGSNKHKKTASAKRRYAQGDTSTASTVQNPYEALKKQLATYVAIAKQGGWQPVSIKKKLRKGVASPAVTSIKKRLQQSGDMP